MVGAAEQVAARIRARAARMISEQGGMPVRPEQVALGDAQAWAPDGRSVTMEEVALNALHHEDQEQIMGVASYVSPVAPPPFAAQFAEVTVDIETGQITVDRLVMVVDSGIIVNPLTASGQIEGGMTQALGYAVSEEMLYDDAGRPRELDFTDYHIFAAHEMPELETLFVETFEPFSPVWREGGGGDSHGWGGASGRKCCARRQRRKREHRADYSRASVARAPDGCLICSPGLPSCRRLGGA